MKFHCQCGHIFKDSEAREEGEVSLCPKCGSPHFVEVPQGCLYSLFGMIVVMAACIIGGCLIVGFHNPRPYFVSVMVGITIFFQFISKQWTYHKQITSEDWKNCAQNPISVPASELEVPESPELPQDSQPVKPSEEPSTGKDLSEQTFHIKSNLGCIGVGCHVFLMILMPLALIPFVPLVLNPSLYSLVLFLGVLLLFMILPFISFRNAMMGKVLDIDANGITYTSDTHWSAPWSEIEKIKYNVHDVFMFFVVIGQVFKIRVDLKDGKTHFKARIVIQDTIQSKQIIGYIHEMAHRHSIE